MEKAGPEKRIKLLEEIAKLLRPAVAAHYVGELASYLDDDSEPVQHACLSVLQKAQELEPFALVNVLGPIAARLTDKDPHIRLHALKMVALTGRESILDVIPFVPTLVDLLGDADAAVAKEAVKALGGLGVISPNAIVGQLAKALDPKQPRASLNGLRALSMMAKKKTANIKRALPAIIKLIGEKKGITGEPAREMLAGLGRADPDLVAPLLMKVTRDIDADVGLRWGALRAATLIAEKHPLKFAPLVDQLSRDLRSNEWELREQAAMLVGNVGRNSLNRVKDAVPALVETLADADELVRSAAHKAIELINISSVDYTRIEKAAKALQSAEFILQSARNFGARVDKAEALVKDARQAFARGQYQDATDYAKKGERLAHHQEQLISQTRDVIRASRDKIHAVARAGVGVEEFERALGLAEKLLKRKEFKAARLKAQRAAKQAEELKERAKPDITLKGRLEQPLKEDTWNPLVISLRNLGAAAARDVTLQFSDTFAVRGPSIIENISAGKGARLKLSFFPKSKGLVPFNIDMTYHSFEGQYYSDQFKDILDVGLEQPDFVPRELFVSPIQATIVPQEGGGEAVLAQEIGGPSAPTQHASSRFAHTEEFSVICENCQARIPSNFRICGRCGHRLPSREEKAHHRCPSCGVDSTGDYKFCGKCGSSLALNCPQCQTPITEGFKFCGRCGAKVL